MPQAYIVAAERTAIGKFQGSLSTIPAVDLGAGIIRSVLSTAWVSPNEVEEVFMGNVLQSGLGQNPARQAALKSGLLMKTPALTINRVCASGLEAVIQGAKAIILGERNVVVSGGMENMSRAPYLLGQVRTGLRTGDAPCIDSMIKDGLWCAVNNYHMGITAENVAEMYNITKEEQDRFAVFSQQKTEKALNEDRFVEEIAPVIFNKKDGTELFKQDESPRKGVTYESIAALPPVFMKNGTVTVANASGINDGAAALVLVSEEKLSDFFVTSPFRIVSWGSVGVDPAIMGIGPIGAVQKALERAQLAIDDIDLFELNEAFAAQSIAVIRELRIDPDIVNVNGGAIALGHPIGASGARILVTLLHEMKKRKVRYGLAGLCVGGGQGTAVIVEKC